MTNEDETVSYGRLDRLLELGYAHYAVKRMWLLSGCKFNEPADIARMLDLYEGERYTGFGMQVRSAQQSMLHAQLMPINAAILAYALLECFPEVGDKHLMIQRGDAGGCEIGHVVVVYRAGDGMIGALGKSPYAGLASKEPVYLSEAELEASYTQAYLALGLRPSLFCSTTLEEAARGIDWRTALEPLPVLLVRLVGCYGFALPPH